MHGRSCSHGQRMRPGPGPKWLALASMAEGGKIEQIKVGAGKNGAFKYKVA